MKLNEQEKRQLQHQKLGFEPTLFVGVAGVTMAPNRQGWLGLASAFVTSSSTLSVSNGGILLNRDKNNKFDPYAIEIWLATQLEGNLFKAHAPIGFIPRRMCTECGAAFPARFIDAGACPSCGATMVSQAMSWINRFLAMEYIDRGLGFFCSVWWINKAPGTASYGCRLALGLPAIAIRPPA
jgi:predicted RNA-binding Zn-ribbon protein involved in translation (DUF1610 family)